jgi:predicted signal transduction protein with EAL and GGDEF domain
VALAPAPGADTDDLLRRADAAMYRAKAHGKARWMMDSGGLQTAGEVGSEDHKNP